MSDSFVELLVLAVLSLVITFVLFRWLESRAEGESPLLGGTIKYGGALAGFVLVFWLSAHLYRTVFDAGGRTEIRLDGEYDLHQVRADGQTRQGSAVVRQRGGRTEFDISGEIESKRNPPSVSFHTVTGVLKGRSLVWLYENDRREMGIALGDVGSDRPDRIVMKYADVLGGDLNADAQGSLVFTRRATKRPAP